MSIAFLFPGQGSQYPGFLHELSDHSVVAETLREAQEYSSEEIMGMDTEESLRSTVAVQLSIYVAGVASARALIAEKVEPGAVAGLSVGAFAAAVICGALKFSDGWRLVEQRARAMENLYPQGYGLAVINGLREKQVAELVAHYQSSSAPVFLGNINAPQQIVIAGSNEGMNQVLDAAKAKGARKAERLPVSVPSHCALLSSVARGLEKTLASMELNDPRIPYVSNRRARPLRKIEAIREDLATNIENPVRWHDATSILVELGGTVFLEMPPGHVLASLAKDAFPDIFALALDGVAIRSIQQQLNNLG